MKAKKNIDEMFKTFQDQWDIEEPVLGHQQRFLDKLQKPKKKVSYAVLLSIAASVVLFFSILMHQNEAPEQMAMSRENKETQHYFNSIIKKELAELKKENDPESKKIIKDALQQMDLLDKDYQKLINELSQKGENKQVIHAMIVNLQTRISFLEEVSVQIENIKQIKAQYHEKNTL